MKNKIDDIKTSQTDMLSREKLKKHSNPITKNFLTFSNANLTQKFSIKDLLR